MRILPQQAASAAYCWAPRLGEKRGFSANRNSSHGVNSGFLQGFPLGTKIHLVATCYCCLCIYLYNSVLGREGVSVKKGNRAYDGQIKLDSSLKRAMGVVFFCVPQTVGTLYPMVGLQALGNTQGMGYEILELQQMDTTSSSSQKHQRS